MTLTTGVFVSCTHFVRQVSATPIIVVVVVDTPYEQTFSARSHGAFATAIGSTIMGVTDTCRTKWVQDPLTATGSVT